MLVRSGGTGRMSFALAGPARKMLWKSRGPRGPSNFPKEHVKC
jgi:hypothetical protein